MDWNAAQTAETNGITMEYFEEGEGTPVLLLHGFPEHPFSLRRQVPTLVEAGFRVIVPSQRGYGGTDAPADPLTYSVKNLVADLTGLLDALGIERAVFFGHDWGSMPAWYSAIFAPERTLGIGSLCTPYFTWESPKDMIETYDELRGPNHYMRTFQEPGVGEEILGRDVEHTFRSMLRGRGMTRAEFEAAPRAVQEVPAGVFVADPQLFGEPIVSDEELGFYVDVYSRTGFTGGLNWYRALRRDFEEAQGSNYVVDQPALLVYAADDWFFPAVAYDGLDAFLPQLEQHEIADAGHWLQQEKPAEVNAHLSAWLQRNFA
ncbi:MAG: alpha/beta hydrolase [Actinobacteria bacterium]|nr:alpha/beta hydrolase [Actinomycetota bacterium]